MSNWPTGLLIEQFPITLSDGRVWQGFLHRTERRTGRRIVVRDAEGGTLFDTSDQYDLGNATNRLDLWLAEQEKREMPAPAEQATILAELQESFAADDMHGPKDEPIDEQFEAAVNAGLCCAWDCGEKAVPPRMYCAAHAAEHADF